MKIFWALFTSCISFDPRKEYIRGFPKVDHSINEMNTTVLVPTDQSQLEVTFLLNLFFSNTILASKSE